MDVPHIRYEPGLLRLLDQTRLPDAEEMLELREWPAVARAIETMQVRGAPAIGITAAYGMALAARAHAGRPDFVIRMMHAAAGLKKARPTAVNLAWAVHRMLEKAQALAAGREPAAAMTDAMDREARAIHEEDIAMCRRIGEAGLEALPRPAAILTICNTGTLATGGYGTALGVVRSAWRAGMLGALYACETRPLLQGARLTTWELARDEIPFTLVVDAAAGMLMRARKVNAVVVGADRIARNGDVANKIGTYALAVLAKEHGLPFVVAAPSSTFDPDLANGDAIPIEQRGPEEVTTVRGARIAARGTNAANPAFDVTPGAFVNAIVTERGVLRPPFEASISAMLASSPVASLR